MIKSKVRDEKIFEDISEKINDNDILKSNINIAERVFSYISFLSRYNDRYDEKDRAYKSIDFVYDKTNGNYDEQTGLVKFDYVIDFNLPYNVLHVENVNSRFVIQRRAFIGIDGNRFENRDELREYIYLADNYLNSHIYHDDISCTYLVKHTYTYQYDEVLHQKNESGEFYTKCDYCFRDITINSRTTCYTTLYGDRFHYRENCPLMTAYVTRVPRDYIERYGLTLCSKCARRSNDD